MVALVSRNPLRFFRATFSALRSAQASAIRVGRHQLVESDVVDQQTRLKLTRLMNFLSNIIKALQKRSMPKVVVWVISGLVMGALFAAKMYFSGEKNLAYILVMTLAAIIAMAMVAPSLFFGKQRDASDWSSEIKALQARKMPPVTEADSKAANDSNDKFASKL